ncbi:hypothetical protein [Vibrio bivalvicida]|uniref:DUF3899 domain-containing protein n=1 Tax=Vibrio bivalvicida TaxID=1276888 RepID=A0ABV4MHB9_9VIBR
MFVLLQKVLLINLTAAIIVFGLSQYVEFFKTTRLIDFLFFIVIIIWVFAKLMWEGGMHSKVTRYDNAKTDSVYTMVKDHDFDKDERENYRQNYQDGFVLFIAGIPAFVACLYLQFLN